MSQARLVTSHHHLETATEPGRWRAPLLCASPPLPRPIHFNKDVVPDTKRSESSRDGGVLWANVPNGAYRVSATHPTQKFATFLITCAPGRVINANPPWGLQEL